MQSGGKTINFFETKSDEKRKKDLIDINKQFSEALAKFFADNEPTWKKKLSDSGFSAEDIQDILEKTKLDAQVSLINDFKKNLETKKRKEIKKP